MINVKIMRSENEINQYSDYKARRCARFTNKKQAKGRQKKTENNLVCEIANRYARKNFKR